MEGINALCAHHRNGMAGLNQAKCLKRLDKQILPFFETRSCLQGSIMGPQLIRLVVQLRLSHFLNMPRTKILQFLDFFYNLAINTPNSIILSLRNFYFVLVTWAPIQIHRHMNFSRRKGVQRLHISIRARTCSHILATKLVEY
jgi:hypothetical protein